MDFFMRFGLLGITALLLNLGETDWIAGFVTALFLANVGEGIIDFYVRRRLK